MKIFEKSKKLILKNDMKL